jgi:hypothetical protein
MAEEWKAETRTLSSITEMAIHPAYQRIIGMGPSALPYLLRRLESDPEQWFWALRAITGADPVKPEHRGRIGKMSGDWLDWARENGFSW